MAAQRAALWPRLHEATNEDNRPTPGYLYHELVRDLARTPPEELPAVAKYLVDCVQGDHAHIKLKSLFVIKNLAYRNPRFCDLMREPQRLAPIREATSFHGPPSPTYGDEPYRLVRDAAEGALLVVTSDEHYHTQYRDMSRRIVGFGNYLPPQDTVLADGSINVTRDVSTRDAALDLVKASWEVAVLGIKDMFFDDAFAGKTITEGLPIDDDGGGGMLDVEDIDECSDPGYDDYRPCAGNYVPPQLDGTDSGSAEDLLQLSQAAHGSRAAGGSFLPKGGLDDVWRPDVADLSSMCSTDRHIAEDDVLQLLGFNEARPTAAPPPSPPQVLSEPAEEDRIAQALTAQPPSGISGFFRAARRRARQPQGTLMEV